MLKLRFVEHYRGRKIVSNGKLFGIEGELVTDCRYMSVAGAKAAIDSAAMMEERERYMKERVRLAEAWLKNAR